MAGTSPTSAVCARGIARQDTVPRNKGAKSGATNLEHPGANGDGNGHAHAIGNTVTDKASLALRRKWETLPSPVSLTLHSDDQDGLPAWLRITRGPYVSESG